MISQKFVSPMQVAAVFAYIESVAAFDGAETSALSCFIAFVRIFMPCFYDGESFSDQKCLVYFK